jgi:hypothetical protein
MQFGIDTAFVLVGAAALGAAGLSWLRQARLARAAQT